MRISTLALRLLVLPLTSSFAATENDIETQRHSRIVKRQNDPTESTTFNGKSVPPPNIVANEEALDEQIASGYHLVEFFSPYCGHCKHFAPTWQTLYEYYYTQEVVPQAPGSGEADSDLNSFTRYYDFHFAKVDCVANGDACSHKGVRAYPTIKLFKDGKEVHESSGARTLEYMSEWVEKILETIKPGTRPEGGPKLPEVGDDHAEPIRVNTPVSDSTPDVVEGENEAVSDPQKKVIEGSATNKPLSTSELANPDGKSVALTGSNWRELVSATQEPWFVKFSAPSCQNCQSIAPNWQALARTVQGQINIGEVNCDKESRLCKDLKIKGYPTIVLVRGGEMLEYNGLRGLGDLVHFAVAGASIREGIPDVTAQSFEELEKTEEVIFLYFYDQATSSEDLQAMERLTMALIGRAKLVKTKDPALSERFKISTWPRLLVSRDGKPSYYNALAPKDMRDFRKVLHWMKSVWLPIVPEITASNAREIMDGKLVVLGILSRDRPEEFVIARREIKNAALEWIDKQTHAYQLERQELRDAKQLRIEEAEDRNDQRALRAAKQIRINMDDVHREEVRFAWVDGVFWERWIRTTFGISVAEGERVVINDEDNHRYWDVTMTGNPIVPSRTSILETLPRIVAKPPKISPKSTASALGHVWWVLRAQVRYHPIISGGVAFGIFIGLTIWTRRQIKRLGERGGYFKISEKAGGPLDGLLGVHTTSQGKVD